MDASLSTTLLHAITFLLTPLAPHFKPQTLDTLHLALLSSLSSDSTQTLVLSLHAPPPQPIQIALNALHSLPPSHRVSYQDWLILLSRGNQVIMSIAPGFVQAATKNPLTNELSFNTIWDAAATAAANSQRRVPSPWGSSAPSRSRSSASSSSSDSSRSSTPSSLSLDHHHHHHLHQVAPPVPSPAVAVVAAENVLRGLEDDEDDLVLLTRPTRNPAPANPWAVTDASLPKYSARPKQASPSSTRSRSEYQHHSRSSSRSSTVSSTAPSLVSCSTNTSATSAASLAHTLSALTISSSRGSHSRANSSSLSLALSNTSTLSSSPEPPSPTPSMDDPSEDVTCYIDSSKNQSAVTEYECGKVGVLTGAVMLGVPSAGKAKPVPIKNMPVNKAVSALPSVGVISQPVRTAPGATQGFKKNANTVWNKRNSFVRV